MRACAKPIDSTLAHQLPTELRTHENIPNIIANASLLDGLCRYAQLDEAMALLEDLKEHGVKPDTVVDGIIMGGLCNVGGLDVRQTFSLILYFELIVKYAQ